MELDLNSLLKGKATRIKNKEYFPTAAYVEPFLERMSKLTDDFIIQAKLPDQISITKDNNINFDDIVFNRVWIQAVLPDEYAFKGHQKVISMLYAIDTRKPIVKFYSGALRSACLNLCVFNPDCLNVAEFEPETAIDYSPVEYVMNIEDKIKETLTLLSSMDFNRLGIYESLGHWVDNCITSNYNSGFGKVKLAESTPINVYKNLFYNDKSPYYTESNHVDGFTIYNAFTQEITDDKRDIVNKFEKTNLIKRILGI